MPDDNLLSRPVLVLVAGAWHGSWAFDAVVPALAAAGYTANTIGLPSSSGQSGPLDKKHDVDHIRCELMKEIDQGRNVAVICHSYAGVPTCDAVKDLGIKERREKHLAGGVCGLVFISAFILSGGTTVEDFHTKYQRQEFHYKDGLIWPTTPQSMFYNDLPDDKAEELSQLLKPHSVETFCCPVDHEAFRFIPSSYLICTNDNAIIPEAQEDMVSDKLKFFILVERLASGHLPFISHPKETVDFIEKTIKLAAANTQPQNGSIAQ